MGFGIRKNHHHHTCTKWSDRRASHMLDSAHTHLKIITKAFQDAFLEFDGSWKVKVTE